MTITLFVEPNSLGIFLQVTQVLKNLEVDNNYIFTPSDLVFSETLISKRNFNFKLFVDYYGYERIFEIKILYR